MTAPKKFEVSERKEVGSQEYAISFMKLLLLR
jgi:hypothetical protein